MFDIQEIIDDAETSWLQAPNIPEQIPQRIFSCSKGEAFVTNFVPLCMCVCVYVCVWDGGNKPEHSLG